MLWAWGPALIVLSLWIFTLQGWLAPSWVDIGNLVFCSMALQVAVLLLGLADDTARLRRERDTATDQAGHDPLTGVLNRRALQQRLQNLLADAGTKGEPLSLVFLDLDHFKRVNDRYGHAVGDQCLCELVGRARLAMRENDVLARYGGEEFVLVLPGRDGTRRWPGPISCARTSPPAHSRPARRPFRSMPVWASASGTPATASMPCWNTPTRRCIAPSRAAATAWCSGRHTGRNLLECRPMCRAAAHRRLTRWQVRR
ncbi:MAG: GGDEF domain-containing protein [Rhodanobacteraceae bacterium]|nr:GGDEF domain-containing protein [Rhodanobacteraceae bacterium]